MRLFSTASTKTAAVAIFAAGFFIAAQPVSAITITHNGFGPPGGVIVGETMDVGVGLVDIFNDDPNLGTEIAMACDDAGVDACLGKGWFTVNDTHSMLIQSDSPMDPLGQFLIGELVFNLTGVPWTDYHVDVFGGDIVDVEPTLFTIDQNGDIINEDDTGITTMLMGNSVWFFFDDPVPPLNMMGDSILFAFLLDIDAGQSDTVIINQHPSVTVPEPATLALFGIGLAGLGFARRRKTAA